MFPVHYLNNSNSTMDDVFSFINKNVTALAVYTFDQRQGRGQYGNKWQSPSGEYLAYSLATKTSEIALSGSLFNYRTATIIRDFVANLTKTEVQIKWPNDIIIKNKKVSGILIEKSKHLEHDYYVIGVGINLLQTQFEHLPKAGSLLTQTGLKMDLEEFTQDFHKTITEQIFIKKNDDEILNNYNAHLYRSNIISVFEIGEMRQNGIIKSADENGFLWVDLENDGLQKFYHKEIQLLY